MSIRTVTLLVAAALTLGPATPAVLPAQDEIPGPVDLVISPADPLLESDADEYEFALRVDAEESDEPLPESVATLRIAPGPLEQPEQLGEVPQLESAPFAEVTLPESGSEGVLSEEITVPAADFPLAAFDPPGVYLLVATVTSDRGRTTSTASVPFVWQGIDAPSVPLGIIVPIVLPSDVHPMPSRPRLEEVAPALLALLDEAEEQLATLAIDPRIIAGIRAYGDNAPASAAELLERLETTALPSFLLQFADADPAAQAALGWSELMQPQSLSYVTRLGSFPEEGSPEGSASQSSDQTGNDELTEEPTAPPQGEEDSSEPDPATVPDIEELLAWSEPDAIAWPAEGQAGAETITFLRNNGINAYVLDSSNVELTGGPRADFGQGSALITDATLGHAVRDAIAADNGVTQQASITRAAATLALATQIEQPGIVLGLDRGAVGDAEDPAAIIEQLTSLGWTHPRLIDELPSGSASLVGSSAPGEQRLSALQSAVDRAPLVEEVGAILRHPEYLESYQQDRLLEFFATRHAAPTADFDEVSQAFAARDLELQQGAHIVDAGRIQLVGASTLVPAQVHNSTPFTAEVVMRVSPSSAALSVPERIFEDIVITGDGNERVMVPVRTRVSSGESQLDITITDSTGSYVSSESVLPITIRSNYEGIALWVLGTIAALLFVFGIIRSVGRRKARTSQEHTQAEGIDAP